ncbi:MAG: ribbon-helix-helix protein, CopG family [Candidatus Spyradosoma sp.]
MNPRKKLVTVVLPEALISEAETVRRRYGIRTLSSLLRTALAEKSADVLRFRREKSRQISFRADVEVVEGLKALAKKNGSSLAEIVRRLIGNVGALPAKKLEAAAKASRKKTAPAAAPAKAPAKKTVKTLPAKKAAAKKPAKKAASPVKSAPKKSAKSPAKKRR